MELLNNYFKERQLSDELEKNIDEEKEFNISELIQYIYSNMKFKDYHHRLHYKKYPEDKLIQLFSETSQEYTKWDIYNVCRSIIFDTKGQVLSYSHPNLEYVNYEDIKEELQDTNSFTESHEGTLIGVFYHNDKWYYTTRRHINMYETSKYIYGVKSELTHGEMFDDCLNKMGMTKEEFEGKLDKRYKYYFELVHYQNAFNIRYDVKFGEKYAKLFLLFVRDEEQNLVKDEIAMNIGIETNKILSKSEVKERMEDEGEVETEGYIFMRNGHLTKVLHPNFYEVMKYSPGYKTKQELYIYLYQKDLLNEYIQRNNGSVYKVEDNKNIDTIGLVSGVFTYIGQRMLDIYFKFNNNNMVHRNENEFKRVFVENKNYNLIFYTLGKMKGIHKQRQINLIEMKKFLKYKMVATDVWKLMQEIGDFEEKEKLINEWSNKLVKYF